MQDLALLLGLVAQDVAKPEMCYIGGRNESL